MRNISDVTDDILGNIMSRLPAKSFAAAACVSCLWNKISGVILSRPRLTSGLSITLSPEVAVSEALEMALSKPTRPHFVIAYAGLQFPVEDVHQLITSKIGSNTILIVCAAAGIMGIDAYTKKLKEVKWECDDDQGVGNLNDEMFRGISLVIGFVPGLKISVIPLVRKMEEPEVVMVDKFISDVRNFTVSVSGEANPDPVGIMMFGNQFRNLKPAIAEIDKKISRETVMMGDLQSYYLCTDPLLCLLDYEGQYSAEAVALVFAKDNQNREVEIKFHMGISGGIIPVGPKLEIMDVWELNNGGRSSWLFARPQGELWPLDASDLLFSLHSLIDDKFYFLYIGVKKEIIPENGGAPIKYTEFHEIVGTHQNMFIVAGSGINRGDTCMFYHSDADTANTTNHDVYRRFKTVVQRQRGRDNQNGREEVFGGMVFASSNRGEKFFENDMQDCLPFSMNFPRVPMGGTFCAQPFGRCPVLEDGKRHSEEERFNMQAFNSVYLAMTYKEIA